MWKTDAKINSNNLSTPTLSCQLKEGWKEMRKELKNRIYKSVEAIKIEKEIIVEELNAYSSERSSLERISSALELIDLHAFVIGGALHKHEQEAVLTIITEDSND
jgi:hypothetical protein